MVRFEAESLQLIIDYHYSRRWSRGSGTTYIFILPGTNYVQDSSATHFECWYWVFAFSPRYNFIHTHIISQLPQKLCPCTIRKIAWTFGGQFHNTFADIHPIHAIIHKFHQTHPLSIPMSYFHPNSCDSPENIENNANVRKYTIFWNYNTMFWNTHA